MSTGFCLLESNQLKIDDNQKGINLGKTVNNTIILNNNNIKQNNALISQAQKNQNFNQNIIQSQNNNDCNINSSIHLKYNKGKDEIKCIMDERNEYLYDIDMNNETEYSFKEKMKDIEKLVPQIPKDNNTINLATLPMMHSIIINESQPKSQVPSSNLVMTANNVSQTISKINNINYFVNKNITEEKITDTEKIPKTCVNPQSIKNNIKEFNLNTQPIIPKFPKPQNEQESFKILSNLIGNDTTKSEKIQIKESNKQNELNINNSFLNNNPTIKSYYE